MESDTNLIAACDTGSQKLLDPCSMLPFFPVAKNNTWKQGLWIHTEADGVFFQYYISVHNRLWLKKKTDKAVYLGFKQKTEVDTRLQFLKDNVSPQNYCNILLCGFQKKSGHMMAQWIRVPNQLCVTFPPKYETDVTAWHGDIN